MWWLLACSMAGEWKDTVEAPVIDTGDADTDTDADADSDADTDADTTVARPGDLVISEIMKDPDQVDDDFGEWFELTNLRDATIVLDGMTVTDEEGDGFTILDASLAPRGRLVFGASTISSENGGASVDFAYDVKVFKLGNSSGEIRISSGDTVVDVVTYDETFPDDKGHALVLDTLDPDTNDSAEVWCSASTPYGLGDFGTPDAANDSCEGVVDPDADDDGWDDADDCDPTDADIHPDAEEVENDVDDDCDALIDERPPEAGELIVTEIMKNPDPTDDDFGEWFELTSLVGVPLVLDGVVITDDGDDEITLGTLIVMPFEHAVFSPSGDMSVNGGLTPTYVYDGASFHLGNDSDEIYLSFDGDELDGVEYDNDFPDDSSRSLSLDPRGYDDERNDDPDYWCEGVGEYGTDGNQGTPGALNDGC